MYSVIGALPSNPGAQVRNIDRAVTSFTSGFDGGEGFSVIVDKQTNEYQAVNQVILAKKCKLNSYVEQ